MYQNLFQINVLADHGGGTDLKDVINGILRHLFTNAMASKFNMAGINRNKTDAAAGKTGLRSTFLYNLILGKCRKL